MGVVSDFFVNGTTRWFQPPGPTKPPGRGGFAFSFPIPLAGILSGAGPIRVRISPGRIWDAIRPAFREKETVTQRRLAVLVGVVAFGLPAVLYASYRAFGSCFRDSISHFYYDPYMGTVFVGMLMFIGGFLIAYHGNHWKEDALSTGAGLGAWGVALFPTTGAGCEDHLLVRSRVFAEVRSGTPPALDAVESHSLFEIMPQAGHLHSFAAGILFIYLGFYCLIVLKRVVPAWHKKNGQIIPTKRRRNVLYTICGLTILAGVAALGAQGLFAPPEFKERWNAGNLTFKAESVVLWSFGLAWIVKGRVIPWFNDPAQPRPANDPDAVQPPPDAEDREAAN